MARPRKNNKKSIVQTETVNVGVAPVENPVQFKTENQEDHNKLVSSQDISFHTTHVVQRGETIQSIAGLYSVPVMKLIKLNGSQISVGQTIYI